MARKPFSLHSTATTRLHVRFRDIIATEPHQNHLSSKLYFLLPRADLPLCSSARLAIGS